MTDSVIELALEVARCAAAVDTLGDMLRHDDMWRPVALLLIAIERYKLGGGEVPEADWSSDGRDLKQATGFAMWQPAR